MTASFPGSAKTFTTKVDNVDSVQASHINDLQDEVKAIEDAALQASGIIITTTKAATATSKATPVNADIIPLLDSAASFGLKSLTWANIKSALNSLYIAFVTPSTAGNVLTSNGSAWTSAAPTAASSDGWIAASTWTRTGDHTFTVATDLTTIYRKGVKVRYKDGGAYEYGCVSSSSYSAPNTTVTLFTNSDFAMAAVTITDNYYSLIENPQSYPHIFNYAPTFNSLTIGNGTLYGKIQISGNRIYQRAGVVFGTTTSITGGGAIINLSPIATPLALGTAQEWFGTCTIRDAGVGLYEGTVYYISGNLYPQVNATAGAYSAPTNITAVVPMTWTTADELSMSCIYAF